MEYVNGFAIIDEDDDFPDPSAAFPDYPMAFGRVLTPELMLRAYKKGIFAWSTNPVSWWSPDPRAIFELNHLHISKRLARKIRQNPFRVSVDLAFEDVIYGCAAPRKSEQETWISPEFIRCFLKLHQQGYAHSLECWQNNQLVGGVLGVAVAGLFSAESMFHTATDASKIALYYLVEQLKEAGFSLLDIQVLTPHTESLGAELISRRNYLARLKKAMRLNVKPLQRRVLI